MSRYPPPRTPARPPNQHDPDVRLGGHRVHDGLEVLHERQVRGVEHLRPVQRDRGQRPRDVEQDGPVPHLPNPLPVDDRPPGSAALNPPRALPAGPVRFAQRPLQDLARRGARQCLHRRDPARALEAAEPLAAEPDQLGSVVTARGPWHHDRRTLSPQHSCSTPITAASATARMRQQHPLDHLGIHLQPPGDDDVLQPVLDV